MDEKRCNVELQQELSQAINRLRVEQQAARDLTARVSRLEAAQSEFDHLREQRRILERELEELKRRRQEKNERVDELRSERNRLTGELREARKKLDELEDVRTYVDTLSRLTLYTRTRFDYERTITRLTAEQKRACCARSPWRRTSW